MHFDKGRARAKKIYLEELMRTEDAREGIQAFRRNVSRIGSECTVRRH